MAVESLGSRSRAKVSPWNDPVIRGWVFQIIVVGLVALLAWFLVSNTVENLQRQKIASGFHYLEREAGFEIGDTMIAYSPASTYARAIFVGLLNTLRVAVAGIILAIAFLHNDESAHFYGIFFFCCRVTGIGLCHRSTCKA